MYIFTLEYILCPQKRRGNAFYVSVLVLYNRKVRWEEQDDKRGFKYVYFLLFVSVYCILIVVVLAVVFHFFGHISYIFNR